MSAAQRRQAARDLQGAYRVSERHACRVLRLSRGTCRYVSCKPGQGALRQRIRELSHARVRYGYKRIHVLLRREGMRVNHKRVYRLYCLERLQLYRKRPRRHVSAAHRHKPPVRATRRNESWAMDFVADRLHGGSRLRVLTVIDVYTRECLAAASAFRMGAVEVVKALEQIRCQRGVPKRMYCDNGSEFSGRLTGLWAYQHQVTLMFSRPVRPTDNAYIESFNRSFRDECLNRHWFLSLEEAKEKIEAWRQEYNESRPHRALNDLSPSQYAVLKAA